ncbi:MAG: EAL domain-containing protein, partial [Candidatus Thiodiazotropha sp. (ex Lucinoma kastoroae)]|nr:EAL domain-containing protein [Candidatus Thiodiazotropha sp. (ex Lucinoma kastoroae)]
LGDGNLHEYILTQLRKYDLPAEKISFEITETAVVSRLDQAARFISLLKRRGFRFALDDFGTGMSSFSYLKRLPVDYIKIDGSFVRNMLKDPVDKAMVESINEIGHLMGLQTIAEYVESDQILEQLIDIGVDYAQGYGVVRPSPLEVAGSDPVNAA